MTLLQLQYFTALSETLHYTRASEKLHISQPSLSYAISELEKELGVKLFQKENRKVTLTAYGQQFLSYVKKSLALLSEGEQAVRQMAEERAADRQFRLFPQRVRPPVPSIVDGFYHQKPANKIRFQFAELSSYDVLGRIRGRHARSRAHPPPRRLGGVDRNHAPTAVSSGPGRASLCRAHIDLVY